MATAGPLRYSSFAKVVLFALLLFTCACKPSLEQKVDRLKKVSKMPYLPEIVADQRYWDVLAGREKAIPLLIARLDDTTTTKATVPLFGGNYTVADIAYQGLETLVPELPIQHLLMFWAKYEEEAGFWNYWNCVRESFGNRMRLKAEIANWFEANGERLKWVSDGKLYPDIEGNSVPHPVGGHFLLSN